jgi:ketosteroid isomerase-like protein
VASDNVELVKRFEKLMVDTFNEGKGDFAPVLELLTEDVVFDVGPSLPYPGRHVGHEGFVKMAEAVNRAWEYPTFDNVELEYLDAGDDRVLLLVSYAPRSRQTGRIVPTRMNEVIRIRDGKISELIPYYWDTVPILEGTGGVKTL